MGRTLIVALPALLLLAPLGCGGTPSPANIALRKEIQELETNVNKLEGENRQLRADLRRLEDTESATTVPTLPQERLEALWTVSGLGFGRLTGIDNGTEGRPLKVYLRPLDETGNTLKAAGAITVEAFNLDSEQVRLGRWEWPLEEARRRWTSGGLLNEYVLECEWEGEAPSEGTQLLVKATFTDALTGRTFEETTEAR